MIRIYNFPGPSRALRPIWLCEELGLAYEVRLVGFPPDADYRARYPIAKIPFLEDGDVAIGESIAMLLYLAETYGPTPLLPGLADRDYGPVRELALFSEATLGATINPLLATDRFAPPDKKESWLANYMESRAQAALDHAEARLGDGPFLLGERFTIADIAFGVSIGMWSLGLQKPLSARLSTYQARLAERPAQQRAMQRAVAQG